MAREQYEPLTMGEAEDFIGRAAWTSAKSVEEIAPHQYVVQKRGQRRDDFSEEEFWRFEALIKAEGRQEIWTPPEGFYDSGNRRSQKNRYLYVGEYAYWFTMPYGAVPMLNREHVSVQEQNPTRTVPGDRLMARMPTPDGVLEAVVVSQNFFPTLRVPDQVERVARQTLGRGLRVGRSGLRIEGRHRQHAQRRGRWTARFWRSTRRFSRG